MKRSILTYLSLLVLSLFSNLAEADDFQIEEFSMLSINSAITPGTYDYLKDHFSKVRKKSLIIIRVNTPGGLISTTKDIITLIGKQENPVAIWVTPEGASASSAGAIIASAAHLIFMSPGTNLGAATPVGLGEDIIGDGRMKALKDLTALVRSLSQLRGRPSLPFERMITKADSLTDEEAFNEKIIDGIVTTKQELINALSGKKVKIKGVEFALTVAAHVQDTEYKQTWGQEILEVLANPHTAYFLFLIGIALVYFEFQAPGGYVMGGIGFCFLTLAAIAFQVLPLNWGALGLIMIGAILLIMELFVTSFGLLGISGVGAFVMGSLFLFHDDEGYISIENTVLFSTLAGVAVAVGIIIWALSRYQKISSPTFSSPVGFTGTVMATNDNHYQVKVRGEIWKAESSEALTIGETIKVIDLAHDKLVLKIKKNQEST